MVSSCLQKIIVLKLIGFTLSKLLQIAFSTSDSECNFRGRLPPKKPAASPTRAKKTVIVVFLRQQPLERHNQCLWEGSFKVYCCMIGGGGAVLEREQNPRAWMNVNSWACLKLDQYHSVSHLWSVDKCGSM